MTSDTGGHVLPQPARKPANGTDLSSAVDRVLTAFENGEVSLEQVEDLSKVLVQYQVHTYGSILEAAHTLSIEALSAFTRRVGDLVGGTGEGR